jgi:hypothetical protein
LLLDLTGLLLKVSAIDFWAVASPGIFSLLTASLRKLAWESNSNEGTPTQKAAAIAHGIPDIKDERERRV